MFRRQKAIVGLDIGSSAVKAVELKPAGKGFRVVAFGSEPALVYRAAIAVYICLIGLVGGRIVPSFTRNWLAKRAAEPVAPLGARVDRRLQAGVQELPRRRRDGISHAEGDAAPEPAVQELQDGGDVALGRHDGFWRFTPGQRRGLGVATGEPLQQRIIPFILENRKDVVSERQRRSRHF